jgi:glycosyltransferase involved in cell wall biosynthesis
MRIAHVSVGALPRVFSDGGGAVQRRIAELASAQVSAGHEVTVISPDVESHREVRAGVQCRYVRCRSTGKPMHIEFLLRARAELARGPKPRIIHVHNEPEGAAAFMGFGAPTVLSFDNFYFRQRWGERLHRVYRSLLLCYDLLLPVSNYCRDQSLRHWQLPPSKVGLLPNGVNVRQFAPRADAARAERERLDAGDDHVLLYLGRICRQKGTHVLLKGFSEIRDRSSHGIRLVLAGPIGEFDYSDRSEESAYWHAQIRRVGATYVGRVPEARLPGLLSMSDIFVMPTIDLEMQGMAALEAQACGVPVVASDDGGLRETVPDTCGVRFTTGESRALADAVLSLLADSPRHALLAAAAQAHAATYAWDRIAADAAASYRRAGAV